MSLAKRFYSVQVFLSVSFLSMQLTTGAVNAQVAGADQGIFNDEEQMLKINNAQVQGYEQEKMQAQRELQMRESQEGPYRLYVQKTIKELSKPGASKNPEDAKKLKVMQDWLQKDNEYLTTRQAQIDNLDKSIQRMQQSQQNTVSNLQNDITAMRENVQDQKDSEKFDRMMKMNYFNELQSEMGACSWGAPPQDGTFNSVGGYGFMGGYGMGMGGRQSGGWGRW